MFTSFQPHATLHVVEFESDQVRSSLFIVHFSFFIFDQFSACPFFAKKRRRDFVIQMTNEK
jgi:hypothetical protein